jgi:hypothetical protein
MFAQKRRRGIDREAIEEGQMASRTKAERSAAAKKGAATRKENEAKQSQQEAKSAAADAGAAISGAALSIAKTVKKAAEAATKRVDAEKSKRTKSSKS